MTKEGMVGAMVLGAGKGTRLAPLTQEMPKPMAPVGGIPIIEHIFGLLSRHGLSEAHVNAHHLGGRILDAYGNNGDGDGGSSGRAREGESATAGLSVRVLLEPNLSGTAGGVRRLAESARARDPRAFRTTFVVVMGDALTDVDLTSMLEHHRERGALATIGLFPVEDTTGYGVVEVGEEGDVVGFQEKPDPSEARSNLANTGIYVFEPEVLEYVPRETSYDFAHDVFPRLLEAGERFAAFHAKGSYWSDVGTLAAYRSAQRDALEGRVDVRLPGALWGRKLRVGEGAFVDPVAYGRMDGPAIVGAGARVGRVARFSGGVVVGDGCVVADGASVVRSVLLPGARVGAGSCLEDCIVGPGYEVPCGARFVEDALFPSTPRVATGSGRHASGRRRPRAPRDARVAV